MKLGTKIYFLKNTEEIILIEKDRKGFVRATSIEEDYNNYAKLKKYNIEAIDRLELEYSELDKLLRENRANSFYIEEGELKFKYIDKDTGEETEPVEEEFKEPLTLEKVDKRINVISDSLLDLTMSNLGLGDDLGDLDDLEGLDDLGELEDLEGLGDSEGLEESEGI